MELPVRVAERRDLPAVLAIAAAAGELPRWSERDFWGVLEADGGQPLLRVFLVAEMRGEVAGFAVGTVLRGVVPAEGEVELIAVDRGARRVGVGRALLKALLARMAGLGVGAVRLEVRVSNVAAIALYGAAGFRRSGLRRGYYAAPAEDALLMEVDGRESMGSTPAPSGNL